MVIATIEGRIAALEASVARLNAEFEAMAAQGLRARLHEGPKGPTRIEKHLSLRQAARLAGVGHQALKAWLTQDLGICFPKVRHGQRILVRERDVELVLEKRRDARAAPRGPIKRHGIL